VGPINELWEILALVSVVVIAGLALLVAFVRGRGGRSRTLPPGADRDGPSAVGADPSGRDDRDGDVLVEDRPGDVEDRGGGIAVEDIDVEPASTLERPASARGRLQRLRARLVRSNSAIGNVLLALLSREGLSESDWEDVEDTLLASDLGVEATTDLVGSLRTQVRVEGTTDPEVVRGWLRADLLRLLDPTMDRRLAASRTEGHPAVILVVGVNGTGKTTSVGKLGRVLVAEDKDVVFGAADTFRAAAADQLSTWGERVGVPTVRSHQEGADPASVAYEAVKAGIDLESDVVIIDTAGRLHTKRGLMDELGKIKRVIEKLAPVGEVLLVLDATTGQNGMRQAEEFAKEVAITGIVLTKMDGTAKGGIVVNVQRKLGVPVKLIGLGEGPDDLAPFDPEAFVDAIIG
jgi:fused signal recognition particle receptor